LPGSLLRLAGGIGGIGLVIALSIEASGNRMFPFFRYDEFHCALAITLVSWLP
jgi:hypothetical protein